MRVLMTGATGVLGRDAVPRLVAAGHEVTGISRSPEGAAWLQSIGASAKAVDLFDPIQVDEAVRGHDTVIHFATALPPMAKMTKRKAWATNDRLRDEVTGVLVDAARAHGVERFIQQSVTFSYADGGDRWLDEASPIDPPWGVLDSALAAERHVERFTAGGGTGVALRLARLYGPGRASSEYLRAMEARKLPLVGPGTNYVSSLFVEDAGTAVVASLGAPSGVYNVADDEPVTAVEYAAILAGELGAPSPRRLPAWLARMVVGGASRLLTVSQRIGHDRFTDATGWTPSVHSVRQGWPLVAAASRSVPLAGS